MGVRPPRIELVIDELVLHGVAPGDPQVARAVDRATRQALAGQPAARRADPAAIGRAVEGALAGRVGR
jgi:hypothetical protein